MLRIFTSVKVERLRPGLNPQTWVPEASMLTTRPPKPSFCYITYRYITFEQEHMLMLESCLQTSNNETVWNELDYRVDVYRITKAAHIEHL